jgi:hypothetical protein
MRYVNRIWEHQVTSVVLFVILSLIKYLNQLIKIGVCVAMEKYYATSISGHEKQPKMCFLLSKNLLYTEIRVSL